MSELVTIHSIVSLLVQVPEEILEQRVTASAQIVGEQLALQIHQYSARHRLGYYPALEFFQGQEEIDQDLLEIAQGIAWFVSELVRSEVRHRLRHLFLRVEIDELQITAYSIPVVRPGQINCLALLTDHYTPDKAKLMLRLDLLAQQEEVEEKTGAISEAIQQSLLDHFTRLEINPLQTEYTNLL